MGILPAILAYLVYAAFWVRLSLHTILWFKSARHLSHYSQAPAAKSPAAFAGAALDLVFFRRLFASSKLLWAGSWTFHISFLIIILRHLRYFLNPVPDCIVCLQPFGVAAGYLLPLSLSCVLLARAATKTKYVSYQNYFILGLLLFIAMTGLLMRNFFPPDLVDVKNFAMGLIALRPVSAPENFSFVLHFSLVLMLIPYLPFHIFTVPLITWEASRRQQGLRMVMHGK